ncbi:acetyltransferase [Winogradskyella sediminis]|uniref:Sugar O-acyltransferase, sialic acid O-acetyltransferase NeuD family n=1 Tax=Winogradskyella sediminis TaxID=1382466 RepID=A0A1H1VGA9_9FLAO|nr:acetyltransferase [Winogradskyella sediminis]REG87713.1 sugar O-acyltransferase (sialic acid O-acetyltransferase NeuD family) [Winogradskyella sediminis]SDS83782.1 sugar O-acyltransferase, sialic acid O-acetyltransferase NeuD family [Winogradskyella sediminis]
MIIVGAKGFAKELLQIVSIDMGLLDDDIVFFDNISSDLPSKLYNRFRILTSFKEVEIYLLKSEDKSFVLGLGNPLLRKKLFKQFMQLGAQPISIISKNAEIGNFEVNIKVGATILSGVKISNSVNIGIGCLIYYNSIITHDCIIGDFVEISPNVNILGRSNIGDNSSLGASSVILPDITIGNNVIVGAGTVVLNDVPNNSTTVGVPGRIISKENKI